MTELLIISRLLEYPDAALWQHQQELFDALSETQHLSLQNAHHLGVFIRDLLQEDLLDAQAAYGELFDRGRATSLHLFEHVHGDSRERGQAMVDLQQTYAQGGLYFADRELPDYLPAVLEFASTQPPEQARAFLGEIAHIINALFAALEKRRSHYAAAMGALLDLAGEKATPLVLPQEPTLDEAWVEPDPFGGCSIDGQSKPDQPQPIHFVRHSASLTSGAAK